MTIVSSDTADHFCNLLTSDDCGLTWASPKSIAVVRAFATDQSKGLSCFVCFAESDYFLHDDGPIRIPGAAGAVDCFAAVHVMYCSAFNALCKHYLQNFFSTNPNKN